MPPASTFATTRPPKSILSQSPSRGCSSRSHAAAAWYSWMSPPSRSRRRIAGADVTGVGGAATRRGSGGPIDPLSTEKSSTRRPAHLTGRETLLPPAIPQEGWSIYGAQRAQPVATGGKWDGAENRSNRPIRNRWQPTATTGTTWARSVHDLWGPGRFRGRRLRARFRMTTRWLGVLGECEARTQAAFIAALWARPRTTRRAVQRSQTARASF